MDIADLVAGDLFESQFPELILVISITYNPVYNFSDEDF